jgi:hypothetical protein
MTSSGRSYLRLGFLPLLLVLTSCNAIAKNDIYGLYRANFIRGHAELLIEANGHLTQIIYVSGRSTPITVNGTWTYRTASFPNDARMAFTHFIGSNEISNLNSANDLMSRAGNSDEPIERTHLFFGKLRIGSDEGIFYLHS